MSHTPFNNIETNELQPLEIEFDLAETTEVNSEGISRQQIIQECTDPIRIFLDTQRDQNKRKIRVLVRRREYLDYRKYFGVVGVFPTEVIEKYVRYIDAEWQFDETICKIIRTGSTLGLRISGKWLPPNPDRYKEGFLDL